MHRQTLQKDTPVLSQTAHEQTNPTERHTGTPKTAHGETNFTERHLGTSPNSSRTDRSYRKAN